MYGIQAFAQLAGVTVRALHHYDALGLLRPARRSGSPYRVYTHRDLARLEQIVVLKYLGLPLREIGALLQDHAQLDVVLRAQRTVLSQKQKQLERAMQAIRLAEKALKQQGEPDWRVFGKIIKELEMENDWSKQYYSPEAQSRIEERKHLWSPELQEKVTAQWNELFADVEAALSEDPKGKKGQELAARWKALVAGFTGGDPQIQSGLNRMYSDQENWPEHKQQAHGIRPEITEWIRRAF